MRNFSGKSVFSVSIRDKGKSRVMINKSFSVRLLLFSILIMLFSAGSALGVKGQYDLVYIWDTNLESVLDYKEQLEEVLDSDIRKRLKIVGKDDGYGVIFDANGSARNVIQEIAHQGAQLREAGLEEAWALEDKGYHELYNVSYGLGPNLEALKKNTENYTITSGRI